MLLIIIFGLLLFLLAVCLRIAVRLKKKHKGVDAWFFLLTAKEFKKNKKLPLRFNNYLLDNREQCYPPGFTVFLSALPTRFLKKYHWLICPFIDSLHLLFLYFFTYFSTQNLLTAILAGLTYAITYTLIIETTTLNSRALGSLFFTFTLLSAFQFVAGQNFLWLIAAVISGFLLLMTHKMSTQALVFSLVMFAVIFQNIQYLLILCFIVAATFLLSGGFYRKILRGHREILGFWKRNWAYLGAHQIYDSSIYKKKNVDNKRLFPFFHQKGIKGLSSHIKRLLGHNPWIIFIFFLFFGLTNFSLLGSFLFWWVVLIYLMAFLTTFLSPLRFLGEGYKYIKLSVFPLTFLIANSVLANNWFLVLFLILISANLYGLVKVAKAAYDVKENDLTPMLNVLKKDVADGVMCLPTHLADLVTFSTQKKVLWGGHGCGWNKLEEFFPVLQKPIEHFFRKYSLHFLLLDKNFIAEKHLELSSGFFKLSENNSYLLLGYKPQ